MSNTLKPVLIVDLDDTLIKTDLLFELAFVFIKQNPLNALVIIYWLLIGGKVGLKNNLAQRVVPRVELLPYRQEILEYIKAEKAKGVEVGLVSASPQKWVDKVAGYLGLFDFAEGSSQKNLKGENKHNWIVNKIGSTSYSYIGDSPADLALWEKCGQGVGINLSSSLIGKLNNLNCKMTFINDRPSATKALVKQLRVHQWAKNALLFLPLLAAHKLQVDLLINVCLAFVAFSLAASTVYILNDLIDVDADRNHHSKKNRPLASGSLAITTALKLFVVTLTGSILVSLAANTEVLIVILGYYFLNVLYTFYFKKEIILDIILLSGMYTVRLFAGAAAASIVVSSWLLSFSTLFFFSLACVKRYTELSRSSGKPTLDGRGYRGLDQLAVFVLGAGTGLLSILLALLYAQLGDSNMLYKNKHNLWLITPILLYWLGRLWLLAGRNEIHDDPVVFAIKDKLSWVAGGFFVVALLISI